MRTGRTRTGLSGRDKRPVAQFRSSATISVHAGMTIDHPGICRENSSMTAAGCTPPAIARRQPRAIFLPGTRRTRGRPAQRAGCGVHRRGLAGTRADHRPDPPGRATVPRGASSQRIRPIRQRPSCSNPGRQFLVPHHTGPVASSMRKSGLGRLTGETSAILAINANGTGPNSQTAPLFQQITLRLQAPVSPSRFFHRTTRLLLEHAVPPPPRPARHPAFPCRLPDPGQPQRPADQQSCPPRPHVPEHASGARQTHCDVPPHGPACTSSALHGTAGAHQRLPPPRIAATLDKAHPEVITIA
ncbi:hypothetical protein A4R44_06264 [Amycolatopsis sp. M39]|nr:hypothetical protein A4R44_06264 [Amycolatopsis sp. M39]